MYPRSSYIIYATQRTGSYLLCDALCQTKVAGKPMEYFTSHQAPAYAQHWGTLLRDVKTYQLGEDYFKHVYATATPNGVFGVKIIWDTFSYCLEQIRRLEGNEHLSIPELLQTAFPQHRSLMITRRDKVRQAISWYKAFQTHCFVKKIDAPDEGIPTNLQFDFEAIEQHRLLLADFELSMELYFFIFGIKPFTVVYEDFVAAREETTLQILDYLEIPTPKDLVFGQPRFQKQADELTEEWVQQYYQVKQKQEMASLEKLPSASYS
jgi:LPS sulfotransferase NodH